MSEERPPLGSWGRLYAAVVVVAVAVMLLLYVFTQTWNIPLEAR